MQYQKLDVMDREAATLEFINSTYVISIAQMQGMSYDLYLQTEHWKHFRAEALKFYQYKCQLCNGKNKELNVHHRDYSNIGRETFNDAIVLCGDCHEIYHSKSSEEILNGFKED